MLHNRTVALDGRVEVHFGNLEAALIAEIKKHPAVVGCVAWLTNEPVLNALQACDAVSILVQKEDFLRPDSGDWSRVRTRKLYDSLRGMDRYTNGTYYSCAGDPTSSPIRCVGIAKSRRDIPPRMHHKFLVFCSYKEVRREGVLEGYQLVPHAVWTGSFNVTHNATMSLENAVVIRDHDVASAYLNEYQALFGLSEPLDWRSEYVEPEYRIGT